LTSTIKVPVNACYPHPISIEADSVVRNLRDDNPLGSVIIPSNQNTAVAYAFVRDRFGNYLGRADMAVWRAESTTIATAAATAGNPFRGIITRQRDGATRVIASQGALIPDTIAVTIAAYRILKLRFVNTVTGQVVTAISMSTDDSISLRLEGQKSNDTTQWVELRGNWTLSFPLYATTPAPSNSPSWTYSPTTAGEGMLSSLYADDQTVPAASVPVTITVAPPSKVSIQLLTPPERRIAGEIITAEVRIEIGTLISFRRSQVHGLAIDEWQSEAVNRFGIVERDFKVIGGGTKLVIHLVRCDIQAACEHVRFEFVE
jgi:hypothetical protein